MKRFRTIWKWLVPGWLQTGDGGLVQYVQGLAHDAFAERCRQTVWLTLPSLAPSDALPLMGRDRSLARGLFEPLESYRLRLAAWRYPRGHRVRGTALGLLDQVAIAIRGTEWLTIDARGTQYETGQPTQRDVVWDWDGQSLTPNWGRYWIVVKSTGTLPGSWDAGEAEGEVWDGPADECWAGEGIHPGEINAVRELARNGRLGWTPAGVRAIYLVIYFDGEAFPVPTGDWDEWGNRPTQDYAFEPLNEAIT